MRPVNPWPGNNSPPGVQPRPANRIRPRLFLSGFCRAGMVEERNLPAGKTAGRSATYPARQSDPSIFGPEITARRGVQPWPTNRIRPRLFLSGFCRAGMVEGRNLPAGKGWKVGDRSSPTMRPVNPWPGNNSPPGVQLWPTNRIRPRLFLSGFCRAGMVEERHLSDEKTAGRSATVPARQSDGVEIFSRSKKIA